MRTQLIRRIALVALVGVVALGGLAACGKKKSENAQLEIPKTFVLTGLPQSDSTAATRPALSIKIDNAPAARPQFGIEKADTIVEERVEGGITRLIAIFQSQDAEQVGPVRSLRDTDVDWLQPLGGLVGYSGGVPEVTVRLGKAGLVDVGADVLSEKVYPRKKGRQFEHSMYTNTKTLWGSTNKGGKTPPSLYEYREADAPFAAAEASAVATVEGKMGGTSVATRYGWSWNASKGAFLRTTDGKSHEIEGVGQIAMPNVVLQFTDYVATPFKDTAGSPVEKAVVTGQGEAWYLSEGKLAKGTWSRAAGTDVTKFTDALGVSVKLKPGQTWLMLVPKDQPASAK